MSKTVIAYLVSVGLNPLKIRGQGYDGATVMSGDKGGVNVLISEHLNRTLLSPQHHTLIALVTTLIWS